MRRQIAVLLCGLVLLACAGCGEVSTGVSVSGTVTRDGQPVEDARILFVPAKGTQGPVVSGAIKGGLYSIPADQGLKTGLYSVKVSLTRVPQRKDIMDDLSKGSPNRDHSFEFDREITGENPQIDIELGPLTN